MNRKKLYITEKSLSRILAAILIACILFPLSACKGKPVEGDIPVVTYENKEIRINGKFFARSERLTINRIDSRVLSMTTDDGYINLDANGNEIKLQDVITDRFIYESTIRKNVDSRLMMRSAPLFVDYDEMMKTMTSYDKSMKLPFILGSDRVSIIYKDSKGKLYNAASYAYKSPLIAPEYAPGEGIRCGSWMTGRIGYGIPELMLKEYKDHWAESSLEIENYEGRTYIWFCIRYEDESENKTYYSAIVEVIKENEKTKYKLVCKEQVSEGFICCDLNAFSKMLSRAG
ncbi:MAG: hypothetical protein K6F03_01705 [Saccharofermentans sp.]|nr:hypothetical protein [Saccharofermentans sp.]